MRGFVAATTLLTVVPVARPEGKSDLRKAALFFPIVGLLLGVVLYGLMLLPVPPLPRAAIVLAAWIVLTGGLHEDGWADTLDATLVPVARERRLEILKDPRIGAHALTGTVLLLLLRFAALTVVPAAAVLVAAVVGRWAMALSLSVARPLAGSTLAARYASQARPFGPTLIALACLVAAAWLTGRIEPVLLAWLAGGLVALAWGAFLGARLGGLSGDAHGAIGLSAELGALYLFVALPIVGIT